MDSLANYISHLPVSFARNKLTVHIDAYDPTVVNRWGMNTHIEVLVPKAYQSSEFVSVAERIGSERPVQILSGANYYYGTDFEIDSILDGLLSFCPPKIDEKQIMSCASMTIPYKVKSFIEKDGVLMGTESISSEAFAIKSKLAVDDFASWRETFFSSHFDANCPFLTFQPNNKVIDAVQPEFLFWLCNALPKPNSISVRVKVYHEDGFVQTIAGQTLNVVTQYTVYCIPVGFVALGLGNFSTAENPITSYEVWLNNDLGDRITEIRTYELDHIYEPNTRYLLMVNSLGGYDTIRTVGTAQASLKVNRNKGEKALDSNYLPSSAEVFVTGITGKKEIAINTGYFDGVNSAYYSELMFAEEIYIATKDGFVPLTLVTESLTTVEDNVDLTGRTFTFEYAKNELGYSDLPSAPPVSVRELVWLPIEPYCIYDPETGLATGYQGATRLTLTYKDTGEPVKGVPTKLNSPGTEGYFTPAPSYMCTAGSAPYKNFLISRLGNYTRNNCPSGYGDYATITIPANTFGGQTQAEATARAESRFAFLNTQTYANNNGTCLTDPQYYNIVPGPPVNQFNYRFLTKPSGITTYFHGGPGAYSGSSTDLVYGNHWAVQGNTNAGSMVYAVGKNDIFLPCSELYFITVYGSTKSIRVKLYSNGVQVATKTITPAEFSAGSGAYLWQPTIYHPSQAKVYCLIEQL